MAKRADDKIIWFDKTDGFDKTVEAIASYVNNFNDLSYIPDYDGGKNLSTLCNICVRKLRVDLQTLTMEQILNLEKAYVHHKTHKTQLTSIRLAKPTADMVDQVAKWLAENTEVRHVYHGQNPNRKLVLLMAIYYVHSIAITDQQT